MKLQFYIMAMLLICVNALASETIKLQSNSLDTSLPHKILLAAVKRANLTYVHPYENEVDVSNARILNDIKSGELDVMWSMTTQELEQDYQALYIPLFKGLLGMRLAIVKKQNETLFSKVKNLNDLRQFVAGQGKTWPDTKILEANNLRVAKTLKYPNLFYMLEGGRFDYFPRGINEPWDEIKRHQSLNLVVEPNILLRYRAPLYFFINKQNHLLKKALEIALNDMLIDGQFDQLFFEDSQVQAALSKANLKNRIIINLDNPLLSKATPLNKTELWFDPLTDFK